MTNSSKKWLDSSNILSRVDKTLTSDIVYNSHYVVLIYAYLPFTAKNQGVILTKKCSLSILTDKNNPISQNENKISIPLTSTLMIENNKEHN